MRTTYWIKQRQPGLPDQPANEVHRASRWTSEQLNGFTKVEYLVHEGQEKANKKATALLELLKQMPFRLNLLDPTGRQASFVHASMQGIREGIYPESSDKSIMSKIHAPFASTATKAKNGSERNPINHAYPCFGVGHTHRPLIRQIKDVLVVNAGSAGLPFDHDTRPSYAR